MEHLFYLKNVKLQYSVIIELRVKIKYRNKLKLENIFKLLKNWNNLFFLRNSFLFKIASILYKKNNGLSIFNEPWDNLIILDACRYDIFKKFFKIGMIKGTLNKRRSKGATTATFLLNNFKNKKYNDIIYITANPWVDKFLRTKFYKIISVWKDGWSDKYHTVLPETMFKYSIDTLIKYPNKKLIIHFMQPHYPYLEYNIRDRSLETLRKSILNNTQWKYRLKCQNKIFTFYTSDIYAMIDKKVHFKLYTQNLELILPYLNKLVDILPGKTILTSDHGEAFGEFIFPIIPLKIYGHRKGFRIPVLVQIPWCIINPEEKNNIISKDFEEKEKILYHIKNLKNNLEI